MISPGLARHRRQPLDFYRRCGHLLKSLSWIPYSKMLTICKHWLSLLMFFLVIVVVCAGRGGRGLKALETGVSVFL